MAAATAQNDGMNEGVGGMTAGSRIIAWGHHQPPKVLTNDELAVMVDTNDEWIRSRTGIVTRHVSEAGESVADLGEVAARNTLTIAGVEPTAVDLVIVATTTSDDRSPNTAGVIASRLGMAGPAIIDVNVACSGFVHALALADMAVRTGSSTRALVIGAERLTAFTDYTDRTTCVLTADGAGAALVERADIVGIGPVAWGSATELAQSVRIQPPTNTFAQDGRQVYKWALGQGAARARRALELMEVDASDVDVLVTHQANLRIIEPLAEQLGLAGKVVVTDVVESGNTSAASIPLGMSKWWQAGRIPGDKLALLFGFGGGFAYAGTVIRTPPLPPGPH
jgi:3-oxoacyl-[acyl-carrier-protein] synthase-3